MKRGLSVCFIIVVLVVFGNFAVYSGAPETIRITCWDGYAEESMVKEFKAWLKRNMG